MKIAVIGSGDVGGALGKGWEKQGHSARFGVRDKSDPKPAALLQEAGSNAQAAGMKEAAQSTEVVLLATLWPATQEAIRSAGNLAGILLDCTNPLKPDLSLEIGHTTSGAEQVAGWAKGARVVKFSTPPAPTTWKIRATPEAWSQCSTVATMPGQNPRRATGHRPGIRSHRRWRNLDSAAARTYALLWGPCGSSARKWARPLPPLATALG